MSSCKLICKPWYIVLLCSDCTADQMSIYLSTQFFILIWCLCWMYSIWSSCISDWGLCIGRGIPSLGVPACWEKGAAAPCSQSLPPGHWYSRRGGWWRKARQSRLTATGMFTDRGLAAPWRHGSLSPVSSVLQGDHLETKMLALDFKNSG